MRTIRSLAAVALLSFLMLPIGGCSVLGKLGGGLTGIFTPNRLNDFAEINLKLKADETKYTAARLRVVDSEGTPRHGVLTLAQYRTFQALEQNVIDADTPVHADIIEWQQTNTRPVSLGGKMDTLLKAQQALIAFVNRETVKS